MTKLGKRYIAIAEESGETFTLDASCTSSRSHCEATFGNYRRNASPLAALDHVLCVDLDYAEPVDATDEQLAMHWERVELHAAEQRAKYWPALNGETVRESETTAMRAVIEAMRPIVEAALDVSRTWTLPTPLNKVCDDNRDHLAAAMAAWEGGERVEAQRDHDRARPKGIACVGCDDADYKCGYHPCGCSCHGLEPKL